MIYQFLSELVHICVILHGDNDEGKIPSDHLARCTSGPIRFQDSLIINIPERSQLILSSNHCRSFEFIYFLVSFVRLSGGPFSHDLLYLNKKMFRSQDI